MLALLGAVPRLVDYLHLFHNGGFAALARSWKKKTGENIVIYRRPTNSQKKCRVEDRKKVIEFNE